MEEGDTRFKVFFAGVVFDPAKRQILIGRGKNENDYLPGATWVFPGGKLKHGNEIDEVLKNNIKKETGFKVANLGAIFSKVYPEQKDLMTVYFLCEVIGGEMQAAGDFAELKWVNPEDIESHFTTSFHPRLKEYIMNLKKK